MDNFLPTYEAWFHLSGYDRIWSAKNPYALHENPLHSSKSGVWFAVLKLNYGPIVL
jgi:hypothetical protein